MSNKRSEPDSHQPHNTHIIFLAPIGLIFMGGLASLYPRPSGLLGIILLVNLVVSGVWTWIGFRKMLDLRPRWRGVYTITHFDLFFLYGAIFSWRGISERLGSALLMFGLLILAAWVGYRYREAILSEVLAPTKWLTRILYFVATGGGGGAVVGMMVGKMDSDIPLYLVYIVFLLLVMVIHSFWIKIEDPDWDPKPYREKQE
ncbi:hypothetical protein [Paludifilum halophilum]|nr:hypothetical protein [Paludifilum halophilum]